MKIKLKKMGIDFKAGEKNGSDVLNHRVRVEFTDVNGIKVIGDFEGYERKETIDKRGKTIYKTVNANSLYFNGSYQHEEGCRTYRPEKIGVDSKNYCFTKAGILDFLSDVTGNNYTEIEFC